MKTINLFVFTVLTITLIGGIMPNQNASAVGLIDLDFKVQPDSGFSTVIPQIMDDDENEDGNNNGDGNDSEKDTVTTSTTTEPTTTEPTTNNHDIEFQKLQQENNDLKQQISDLQQQIQNLNQVLMEQIKVIMDTLNSLKTQ